MTKFLLTTFLAALTAAIPAMAQGPREAGSPGGPRLGYLSGYLNLTDTQKTQAKAIFEAAATAATASRGQLDAAQTALRDAWKANASENELDRLGAAVGTVQGQLAGINAKAQAKFYALLTAEQKTKYDELANRTGGGRGGPGRRGAARHR